MPLAGGENPHHKPEDCILRHLKVKGDTKMKVKGVISEFFSNLRKTQNELEPEITASVLVNDGSKIEVYGMCKIYGCDGVVNFSSGICQSCGADYGKLEK